MEVVSVENGEATPAITVTATESATLGEEPKRDSKRKSKPQRPL